MFQKISVGEKVYGEEQGGGGTSHFSVEKFFFTVPKNFVAEHISLSFTLGIE